MEDEADSCLGDGLIFFVEAYKEEGIGGMDSFG